MNSLTNQLEVLLQSNKASLDIDRLKRIDDIIVKIDKIRISSQPKYTITPKDTIGRTIYTLLNEKVRL